MRTRSWLMVLSPLSISFLALLKAFLLMCVWVKGPHRNAGKMGLKRDSIRSRLSRDKDIPSYLLKLLPVLYIYTYALRGVPRFHMLHGPMRHDGNSALEPRGIGSTVASFLLQRKFGIDRVHKFCLSAHEVSIAAAIKDSANLLPDRPTEGYYDT